MTTSIAKRIVPPLLFFVTSAAHPLLASTTVYSGPIGSPSIQILDGGYAESNTYFVPVASAGMQVSVDPTALNLQFQTFRFQSNAVTLSRNVAVTAGFGITKNYNIQLALDPITYQISDNVSSHGLLPTTGGNYDIQDTGNLNYVTAFSTSAITGSYTILGPTETATGSFSMIPSGTNYMIVPNVVNTNNYPTELVFSHSNNQFYTFFDFLSGASEHLTPITNDNYFFNRIVDGENISWGFWRMQFSGTFGTTTPGALAPIPEPSTWAVISVGALLVFARRRSPR